MAISECSFLELNARLILPVPESIFIMNSYVNTICLKIAVMLFYILNIVYTYFGFKTHIKT